jgi:hypothetical protein
MTLTKLRQTKVLCIALVVYILTGAHGYSQQTNPRPSVDRGSIEDRFNYILKEGVSVDDSKTVKAWWLYHLKTFVIDSVKALQNEIDQLHSSVSSGTSKYDTLNTQLKLVNEKLELAVKEKNNISLIGIPMNKHAYNTLLWSIIAGLGFLLIVFILMYKRSNLVTNQTKKDADELKNEFDTFRKRAREREEELVRKHHNEIQKYKGNK